MRSQQVGTDGQKNFLFINLRCKGNNKIINRDFDPLKNKDPA